jgi:hypothetical protein
MLDSFLTCMYVAVLKLLCDNQCISAFYLTASLIYLVLFIIIIIIIISSSSSSTSSSSKHCSYSLISVC